MPTQPVLDKHGHPISPGDIVYTPFRGGKHEGRVEAIVTSSSEIETAQGDEAARAEAEKVTKPPKVVFHDQKGRRKEHRPMALSDLSKDEEGEVEGDLERPVGQRPEGVRADADGGK